MTPAVGTTAPEHPGARNTHPGQSTGGLALLALGVVYGDIGTSPLYAVKETFNPQYGIALNEANILGGISAIFWALMMVVSLKYVTLVLRADNRGEGGIMALLALTRCALGSDTRAAGLLTLVGVAGAALFYGDAVLTPAISVLSAVEGLEVGTDLFKPWVVPLSAGILLGLFLLQRQGTRAVGTLFGPICLLWFAALAAAGLWNVVRNPRVLAAVDPTHAWHFISAHGFSSFMVLGAVLLAVTGAEALYADMGHFGRRAVRLAWFALVAPALMLNYFGQGALLMADAKALDNPFYLAFPQWSLYPMVTLATLATVIASQATISGAYSMTQQAIQLGFLPRMRVLHTSSHAMGQIYMPVVNWLLLAAVIAAVAGFASSARLASAYGVSVMGTMTATTVLTFVVVRRLWRYPLWLSIAATGVFLLVDLAFLSAALHKVFDGGWFPLLLGSALLGLMLTWRHGRAALLTQIRAGSVPLGSILESIFLAPLQRVPGTAVFLTSTPDATPHALLHSLKHYQVLHQRNVFLTVEFRDVPWVPEGERVGCEALGHDCWRVTARYGFMDRPDILDALARCGPGGLYLEPQDASYFLSREIIVPVSAAKGRLKRWRDGLFAALARNAGSVVDFFRLPANRVVELGTRVEF